MVPETQTSCFLSLQAHIYHYTQVDNFEESEFIESVNSLVDLKHEYDSLEKKETQSSDATARLERLKISGWAYHFKTPPKIQRTCPNFRWRFFWKERVFCLSVIEKRRSALYRFTTCIQALLGIPLCAMAAIDVVLNETKHSVRLLLLLSAHCLFSCYNT